LQKPDFAKYTEAQLRQILTRIDRERFPERVEEIQARLAGFEANRPSPPEIDALAPPAGPTGIAGFWRRSGAFVIDFWVLGALGWVSGLFLSDLYEVMGAWGRAVGFVISLTYFGIMESRVFQGRTIGKRVLDIKLVTSAGIPLGVGPALLRSAVFFVPYFLNNAALDFGDFARAASVIQALLVFGLGGGIAYLYVFNRRTRQSLHDLLTDAVVVRASTIAVPDVRPVWRGHVASMAALLVAMAGGSVILYARMDGSEMQALSLVRQRISGMPAVRAAGVVKGVFVTSGAERKRVMTINVLVRTGSLDDSARARAIAAVALAADPSAQAADKLSVTLTHGYDIGIASQSQSRTFEGSPVEWRTGSFDGN